MTSVELVSFKLDRKEISNKLFKEIIGIDTLPLANTYVEIIIKNIPTAYINAFRRVSIDELTGYALQIPTNVSNTTDEFMLPQFINQRISLIPLKINVGNDYGNIKFNLIVTNDTVNIKHVYSRDLKLVSGKLSEPIFNPTFIIGILQPGRTIDIRDIYIASGIGKDNTIFQRARCARYTHLDIPQYSSDEINNGKASDYSGYKISSLVSNPKHHKYSCILAATNNDPAEIKNLFIEVCNNIKDRIRYILLHIETNVKSESVNQSIKYNIFQLTNGIYEGVLEITGETYTIGELLKRTIFDQIPDIINIIYNIIVHDNKLKIVIQHKEHVTKILINALNYCLSVFDSLQKQINEYNVKI